MTIPELLTTMAILAVVMTGILVVFVGGLNATTGMNERFQAQQDARLALSSLRYEVGFACSAPAVAASQMSLVLPDATTQSCTGSTNQVTWCASSSNGQPPFGLYRQVGSACAFNNGIRKAGSLTTNAVFSSPACVVGSRPQLTVTLPVDANLRSTAGTYTLSDTITLRNAGVKALCP